MSQLKAVSSYIVKLRPLFLVFLRMGRKATGSRGSIDPHFLERGSSNDVWPLTYPDKN